MWAPLLLLCPVCLASPKQPSIVANVDAFPEFQKRKLKSAPRQRARNLAERVSPRELGNLSYTVAFKTF